MMSSCVLLNTDMSEGHLCDGLPEQCHVLDSVQEGKMSDPSQFVELGTARLFKVCQVHLELHLRFHEIF